MQTQVSESLNLLDTAARNMWVMGFQGRRETELLWAALEAFAGALEAVEAVAALGCEARGTAEGGMLWPPFGEETSLCVHWSSAILVRG